jgi:hypothetical protein
MFSRVILFLGLMLSSPCLVQGLDRPEETKVAQGQVKSIDWVAGKLAVATFYNGSPDEITFIVVKDTKISKGTHDFSLANINQSDQVVIRYYDDGFAGLKALSIVVLE